MSFALLSWDKAKEKNHRCLCFGGHRYFIIHMAFSTAVLHNIFPPNFLLRIVWLNSLFFIICFLKDFVEQQQYIFLLLLIL